MPNIKAIIASHNMSVLQEDVQPEDWKNVIAK